MSVLIRILFFLLCSVFLTFLKGLRFYSALSSVSVGILVAAIYYLFVYLFPSLLLKWIASHKARASSPAPVSHDTGPSLSSALSDLSNYKFFLIVSVVVLVVLCIQNASQKSAIEGLKSDMEELISSCETRVEEAYNEAEQQYLSSVDAASDGAYLDGYSNGYDAGLKEGEKIGYHNGLEYGRENFRTQYYDYGYANALTDCIENGIPDHPPFDGWWDRAMFVAEYAGDRTKDYFSNK